MTSDEQRERAAFEAWIESKWSELGFSFEWTPGAGYPAPFVEDKWIAWQACAAQQAPQARAAWIVEKIDAKLGVGWTQELAEHLHGVSYGPPALAANPQQSNEEPK